jgi:hypothetical protein
LDTADNFWPKFFDLIEMKINLKNWTNFLDLVAIKRNKPPFNLGVFDPF